MAASLPTVDRGPRYVPEEWISAPLPFSVVNPPAM